MKDAFADTPFDTALLHPRYWVKWLGILFLSVLNLLPFRVLDAIGSLVGSLAYRYYEKHGRLARLNLQWCLPELDPAEREKLLKAHFIAYMQAMLMLPQLWWQTPERWVSRVRLENPELLDEALASGPVIIVSCHNVFLDFGATAIAWRYSMVSMYRHFKNPFDEWLMRRGRARFRNHLVARGDSLRGLIRLVRQGIPCYQMPDEDLGPKGAVFAPFFDRPKATVVGMAKMVRAAKASVLPCHPTYLGNGRFSVRFFPVLENYPVDDELENATRINAVIEDLIRRSPPEYLWKLRLFQTSPDGSPSPYKRSY